MSLELINYKSQKSLQGSSGPSLIRNYFMERKKKKKRKKAARTLIRIADI